MEKKGLELVHTELKRDTWLFPDISIHTPQEAVKAVSSLLENMDREMIVALHTTKKGHVISAAVCSIGTMDVALVDPAGIFRTALLAGAANLFLLHNHPSGDCSPSNDDAIITKRVASAGDLIGVVLLDHLIVGGGGRYFSFRESAPQYLAPLSTRAYSSGQGKSVQEGTFVSDESSWEKRERLRQETVEELLSLIKDGESMYDSGWSCEAMAPRNPVTGTVYKGSNRLILMLAAKKHAYQDPRWMTYKNLSGLGYRVKKGEHPQTLEKWKFTEQRKLLDENGMPVLDQRGKVVYEEVPLKIPLYRVFGVYNGEQIEGLPPYQPRSADPGELEKKVDALLESSECTILETAQDEAFYQRGCDTIYLPLRSAFCDLEAFASTAAHEMIHSTGHPSRLNRAFGKWPAFGPPDDLYCMEELRAELGSLFLMNDLQIPLQLQRKRSSAAYMEHYIRGLRECPNVLFRVAADAGRATDYLLERFEKIRKLERKEDLIPQNRVRPMPAKKPMKRGRAL